MLVLYRNQRAVVAGDSVVENLKVVVAKLKAEKTDLVAMNSGLELKLSQRFPEDFVAVQFAVSLLLLRNRNTVPHTLKLW